MTYLIIVGDLQIDAVCNEYTFCCETEWNRTCAETARKYCEASSPTASLTNPPNPTDCCDCLTATSDPGCTENRDCQGMLNAFILSVCPSSSVNCHVDDDLW